MVAWPIQRDGTRIDLGADDPGAVDSESSRNLTYPMPVTDGLKAVAQSNEGYVNVMTTPWSGNVITQYFFSMQPVGNTSSARGP